MQAEAWPEGPGAQPWAASGTHAAGLTWPPGELWGHVALGAWNVLPQRVALNVEERIKIKEFETNSLEGLLGTYRNV